VVVDGSGTRLVVTAASAPLRRQLGPVAWCALEILVLNARRDADRRLVASLNARDLAHTLGVGRDAATNAVSALRRSGLVASSERRGSGGRFAGTQLVLLLPLGEVIRHRASGGPPEPTLFDLPSAHVERLADNTRHRDDLPTALDDTTPTTQRDSAVTPLPKILHTLALGMPTVSRPGDAGC
jgi:DNA-binding transcriptional ArsR family regulator